MYSNSNITPLSHTPIPLDKPENSIPKNMPVASIGCVRNYNLSPVPSFARNEYERSQGPTFDLSKMKACLNLGMPFNVVAWGYGINIESHDYQFLQMIACKSTAQYVALEGSSYLIVAGNFGLSRGDDEFIRLQMSAVNGEGKSSIQKGESWQSVAARLEFEPGGKALEELQMLAVEIEGGPRILKGESWQSVANELGFAPEGEAYVKLQKIAAYSLGEKTMFADNHSLHGAAETLCFKSGDSFDMQDYSGHCTAKLFEPDIAESSIPPEEFNETK